MGCGFDDEQVDDDVDAGFFAQGFETGAGEFGGGGG